MLIFAFALSWSAPHSRLRRAPPPLPLPPPPYPPPEGIKIPGACTAVIARLNNTARLLRVVNLGDSGLLLIRGGELVAATTPQQHYFDCPFQLADKALIPVTDTPDAATTLDVPVEAGDLIMLASDGVFDNCDMGELTAALVAAAKGSRADNAHLKKYAREAALAIANVAERHSLDTEFLSPYMKEAIAQGVELSWREKLMGRQMLGGKPDDITCVVAFVVESTD